MYSHCATLQFLLVFALILKVSNSSKSECCNTSCCNTTTEHGPLILNGQALENFGTWGKWDFCPPGTFVTGMQLLDDKPRKFAKCIFPCEKLLNYEDNSALNGIKLICSKIGSNEFHEYRPSSVLGNYGRWHQAKYCDIGVVNGFQLYSSEYRKFSSPGNTTLDNVGAVNIRLRCIKAENKVKWLEGDITDLQAAPTTNVRFSAARVWTAPQFCRPRQAITGIRTRVDLRKKLEFEGHDPVAAGVDIRGLTNIEMRCDDIALEPTCVPIVNYQFLTECNNVNGTLSLSCRHEVKKGSQTSSTNRGSKTTEDSIMYSLGFSADVYVGGLYRKFSTQFGIQSDKGQTNLEETSYFWNREIQHAFTLTVNPGVVQRVFQLIGECGILKTRGADVITDERVGPIPKPLPEKFTCGKPQYPKSQTTYRGISQSIRLRRFKNRARRGRDEF